MSAVCALLRLDGAPVTADTLNDALRLLEPHGRDGSGCWAPGTTAAPVAMGWRLHATTPEDVGDRQPLISTGGALVLVADARIDNHDELARTLDLPRAADGALPDASFILAAYRRWGEDCVERLIGEFAFILWDATRASLIAARDHLGRRCLAYHNDGRKLALASTAAAVAALARIPRRLNEQKVADYLLLLQDAETTYYQGVLRLMPGHVLTARNGTVRIRRYWAPDPDRRIRLRSDDEYVEAFREIFDEAVRCRLRSTTPIGVLLSGGLDSSSVAAVAATQLRERGETLGAFHLAPPENFVGPARRGWTVDETGDVRALAALHPALRVELLRPSGRTPFDGLEELFGAIEAPVRNPGNLPGFRMLYERAAECGMRVVLNGQKGNATLSYTGLRSIRDLALRGRWIEMFRQARALARARGGRTWPILRDVVVDPLLTPLLDRLRFERTGEVPTWAGLRSPINPQLARELALDERYRARGVRPDRTMHMDGRAYRILMLTSGGDAPDVTNGLRAHYGVETRDPTGDVRVVEFCLAIPEDQYLREGTDRWLVRRAMRELFPEQLTNKTLRGTQTPDWAQQLEPARERIAADLRRFEQSESARRCLDLAGLRRLVDQWPARLGLEHAQDYQYVLVRGVTMGRFILWFEGMAGE